MPRGQYSRNKRADAVVDKHFATLNAIISADQFIAFMEKVWSMGEVAHPDGGITIFHPDLDLYNMYQDARRTIRMVPGITIGRYQQIGGEMYQVVDMPNGDRLYVREGALRKVNRHL